MKLLEVEEQKGTIAAIIDAGTYCKDCNRIISPTEAGEHAEHAVKTNFINLHIYESDGKYYLQWKNNDKRTPPISVKDWRTCFTNPWLVTQLTKAASLIIREVEIKRKEVEEVLAGLVLEIENNEEFKAILAGTETPQIKKELEEDEEWRRLRDEAYEILNDPLLLQKIRTILDFKIAGFGKKKLAVLLFLKTKNLQEPDERVSLVAHGKWSEGKSLLIGKPLEFYDYIQMNEATLAGVYRDSLKNPRYYDGKILYFGDLGDTVKKELLEVLDLFKQLVTEGKVVKKVTIKKGDDFEVVDLVLEGHPILVWTAQTLPEDPQHLSRIMPIQPEISERQREIVKVFNTIRKQAPPEKYYPEKVRELEEVVKIALKVLEREALPILNPYAELINDCMSIHSPNINRDRNKFFGIVHAITQLYQFQRAKIKIEDQEYVVVHPVDILYALYLVGEEFQILFGALDTYTQKTYEEVIKQKVEPLSCSLKELRAKSLDESKEIAKEAKTELANKCFTNRDLAEWLDISTKHAWEITTKLYKLGFLEREKEGKEYKYYLLPEYKDRTKVNGIVLFDSARMIEGLLGDRELRAWLDRYSFWMSEEDIGRYTITSDDLKHILTPEARVFEHTYVPLWNNLEERLFKPPATFNYLLEKDFILADRNRMKDESLEKEEIKQEDKNEEQEELDKAIDFEPLRNVGICELCGEDGANVRILFKNGKKIIAHALCAFDTYPELKPKSKDRDTKSVMGENKEDWGDLEPEPDYDALFKDQLGW